METFVAVCSACGELQTTENIRFAFRPIGVISSWRRLSLETTALSRFFSRSTTLTCVVRFDYGEFRNLAELASSSATYLTFGFVFEESGAYVFSSSCDSRSIFVLVVMPYDVRCVVYYISSFFGLGVGRIEVIFSPVCDRSLKFDHSCAELFQSAYGYMPSSFHALAVASVHISILLPRQISFSIAYAL